MQDQANDGVPLAGWIAMWGRENYRKYRVRRKIEDSVQAYLRCVAKRMIKAKAGPDEN